MNKWISAAAAASLLLVTVGCSSGNVGTNAASALTGEGQTAKRVIATTVAATEIMDALEVDLVGIPKSYKKLPERYNSVTQVGNPMSPSMEVVKSLDPSEVLSVTTLEYDLAPVFKNANVEAKFLDLTSVDKMNKEIMELGNKYDKTKQAEAIVNKFNIKLAQIKKDTEGKKAPSVLILLGVPGSYLVATENSYIGDLVKLAGGKNVVQGEKVEYLASNTEYLQQSNPDVILRAAHGMPEEVVIMFDKEFKKNDIWKHFEAVKNNRVYDLEEELFGTTGNLAATQALDALVKILYP
ncbi:heme ABC transporter substrate-binding protein IsdE [Paenibacillus radicis (ex Xue et al. 2023)]|uniref:High-affinity heme uptake system protein IsdE n=1 Tax=Paenibacillus radicis (ex Xue et al. 2023) TaxID=2972489 RepID=A0ABT1YR50_9BACL|nr:heme ABC transporter substrate-binding protein IsdE [Paenibacillus radicis (ex Xue et al. 2023)]MCR8635641.1 heme ABC transporter substrate-binding protein IsdE [Paenibacillus radicis (ex Xue et al. 2023)]